MKIVITGHQGLLGQELVAVFSPDHNVVGYDVADLDITDASAVTARLKLDRPDVVINAAAFNNVDACEDPVAYKAAYKVNVLGPKNLATAALAVNSRFVHYSTDYVFPGNNRAGYSESDQPQPINAYGQTKYLGEKLSREANPKTIIIRTTRIFGQRGIGQSAKATFVDTMLQLAAKQPSIKVVNDEFGKPTYAFDLAEATKNLLAKNSLPGIYHLTNEGVCSWYEFAQEIFRLTGNQVILEPISSADLPRPAKRPVYSALQNTKLHQLRAWQDALRVYLASKN